MTAPLREVKNIVEVVGARGGVLLVHVLECGHWMSHRKPRERMRCAGCDIERQLANDPNVTNIGPRAIASQAVEAALAAAVGVYVQDHHHHGPIKLTNNMARAAREAARPFLDALGAPTDGQDATADETASPDLAGTERD